MARSQKILHCRWNRKLAVSFVLTAILGFLANARPAFSQVTPGLPSLDDILNTDTPALPDPGAPEYHPVSEQVPEAMAHVAIPVNADERQELSTWVKWLVLKNLPPNYQDKRKWNRQKEIVSGLDVKMDGLRLDTKRRRKMVNHGAWSRYEIDFVEPAKELVVDITRIEFPDSGLIDIQCRVETPLKLFGRLTQWQRDVQIFSLSVAGRARVELTIDATVQVQVNPLVFPPDVEFRPKVTKAHVNLKEFEVDRVSHIGGDAAELVGKAMRKTLEKKLEDYDEKVVEKMNKEIEKQKGRLKLSLSEWGSKKLNSAKPQTPER